MYLKNINANMLNCSFDLVKVKKTLNIVKKLQPNLYLTRDNDSNLKRMLKMVKVGPEEELNITIKGNTLSHEAYLNHIANDIDGVLKMVHYCNFNEYHFMVYALPIKWCPLHIFIKNHYHDKMYGSIVLKLFYGMYRTLVELIYHGILYTSTTNNIIVNMDTHEALLTNFSEAKQKPLTPESLSMVIKQLKLYMYHLWTADMDSKEVDLEWLKHVDASVPKVVMDILSLDEAEPYKLDGMVDMLLNV